MIVRLILFPLLLLFSLCAKEAPDFDLMDQGFVKRIVRVEIPGMPDAFNPSIVRWNGRLLMSFRVIPNRLFVFNSFLGVVWLDDELNLISEPQLLALRDEDSFVPSRTDEGRLIVVEDRLYFVYSDNADVIISKGGFRVYVAELKTEGDFVYPCHIEKMEHFEGVNPFIREKNWVPFAYQNSLFLSYSITPHLVLAPRLDGSGILDTVCLTSSTHPDWNWGVLRGGTPGLLLNDDEYISFFHSSKKCLSAHSDGREMNHYFMGAYTFSSTPPFALSRVSQEPLFAEGFYNGPYYTPYWGSVRVVFPCGILMENDEIVVTYGRQDRECWFAFIDKEKLLDSLVPFHSD